MKCDLCCCLLCACVCVSVVLQVGMVFQSYALFNHLTVADNIKFGLQVGTHCCSVGPSPYGQPPCLHGALNTVETVDG